NMLLYTGASAIQLPLGHLIQKLHCSDPPTIPQFTSVQRSILSVPTLPTCI
ncbi:hypothetical protein J6590_057972, partial [Homalodisca vitripennis]